MLVRRYSCRTLLRQQPAFTAAALHHPFPHYNAYRLHCYALHAAFRTTLRRRRTTTRNNAFTHFFRISTTWHRVLYGTSRRKHIAAWHRMARRTAGNAIAPRLHICRQVYGLDGNLSSSVIVDIASNASKKKKKKNKTLQLRLTAFTPRTY